MVPCKTNGIGWFALVWIMRMSYRTLAFGALAAALLGSAVPLLSAEAADLDYGLGDAPPPLAETKVEFGTGWYVRGDIGATSLPAIKLGPPVSLPTADNQLPPGPPSATIDSGSHVGYVASLAGGYQFNKWFRSDLGFDFHQPLVTNANSGNGNVFCVTGVSYPNEVINPGGAINYGAPALANGGCTGNYTTKLNSYDVLVNAYIDLGTWYHVTPYVGAGVGLSFGHYQTSAAYVQANGVPYHITYTDPQFGTSAPNFDRQQSGTYYNFAFAAMAGFAVDVYSHTKLDIGYRYLNLGSVPGLTGGSLQEHEVRAGLRYMIDN